MDCVRILLTGCNRGLGKDLLDIIATKTPSDYFVLCTARKNIQDIQQMSLKQYPQRKIQVAELDLSSKQSVNKLFVHSSEKGYRFDAIINNAAVGADWGTQIPSVQIASSTMETNVFGTIYFTQKFLPILKENGRIINVSSRMAGLRYQGQNIQQIYSKEGLQTEDICDAGKQYIKRCEEKDMKGYYKSAYGTSKMLLNYWSRFCLSKVLKNTQTTITMSPGHCKTDMGGVNATRTSMDGAMTIFSHLEGEYKSDEFYHLGLPYNFLDCGKQN